MAVQKSTIKAFISGTHNLIDDELIPQDAASTSMGWLTRDGKIELMYGRQAQGAEGWNIPHPAPGHPPHTISGSCHAR
jgi:hypothetical protein